ncbi:MAG: helix-turn-helix transcriptional regulator [Bacteroidales bacterium]|nr:helix-turn-helix transcriptional regulator [Bacteroidales bacterium]
MSSSSDLIFNKNHSIENDFSIAINEADFPIKISPYRIHSGFVCICLSGSSEIEIDFLHYHIVANDIIILFPGQIIDFQQKSDDYTFAFFSFSNRLIDDIIFQFPTSFINFLKEHVQYHLPEEECQELLSEYFYILYKKFTEKEHVYRREIIVNLIQIFFLDLYNKTLKANIFNPKLHQRKTEVIEKFFNLVKIYYKENREVAFYADKLCITPKYLSVITQKMIGKSAKEAIDNYTVTEIKLLLQTTSIPLKEVVFQLNFPNQPFFCKYFKRHTGVAPFDYRNSRKKD